MKLSITKETEITQSIFDNLIITALEGGSNYWYELNDDEFCMDLPAKAGDYDTLTEKISKALFTNPDFQMKVYDKEIPDEVLGTVTQESIMKAFELANLHYSVCLDNIISDDYDAEDADVMFQLATMGEVVFG